MGVLQIKNGETKPVLLTGEPFLNTTSKILHIGDDVSLTAQTGIVILSPDGTIKRVDSLLDVNGNSDSQDVAIVYGGTHDLGDNSIAITHNLNWKFIGFPKIITDSTDGVFDLRSATLGSPIIMNFEGKVDLQNRTTLGFDDSGISQHPYGLININSYSAVYGIDWVFEMSFDCMGFLQGNPSPTYAIRVHKDDFGLGDVKFWISQDVSTVGGLLFENGFPIKFGNLDGAVSSPEYVMPSGSSFGGWISGDYKGVLVLAESTDSGYIKSVWRPIGNSINTSSGTPVNLEVMA